MPEGSGRISQSSLIEAVGGRAGHFTAGVQLLLERMSDDEAVLQALSESSAAMTAPARAALSRMAVRLALPKEASDPARFLFAVQTYYALVVKLLTWAVLDHVSEPDRNAPSDLLSREDIERFENGECAANWGVADYPGAPRWGWYRHRWDEPLGQWLRDLNRRVHELVPLPANLDPAEGHDLFGPFYMSLFPKQVRHALGEHYTPAWLADHVLDQVGFDGTARGRLLDPTCGSGVFLLLALDRLRRGRGGRADLAEILGRVVGMDVNDLAVLAARANYLLAVRDLLGPGKQVAIPIHLRDVVRHEPPEPAFDFLVGNPPWLAWDHLPGEYRRQTKELWQRYGLFSLSGNEARHGGGKKDLAMLVLYAGADRYLRDGGRLGMVVTQTLFQTRGAGDGFRRFRLGDEGAFLKVHRVDDLVDVQPFDTASNWSATIVLEKGSRTTYPVPYVRWLHEGKRAGKTKDSGTPQFVRESLEASPIDPQRPQSPWVLCPAEVRLDVHRLAGPSDYTAHLGANTGGANGVYWLKLLGRNGELIEVENLPGRGKQLVPSVRTQLEPGLLYPLVRWSDVGRFRALPSVHLLLVQDPSTRRGIDESRMMRDFPEAHAYLKQFESQLHSRRAYRRYQGSAPFYSMYNVGEYTVAPHKVVWRRMDRCLRAAVLEPAEVPLLGLRPIICQETCAMIATESSEEAHYLAAMLNSSVVGFLVEAHNVPGGKGFGSPGMLEFLGIRRFDAASADHRELTSLGRAAQAAAAEGGDLGQLQEAIDTTTARIYQIDPSVARSLVRFTAKAQ